MVKIMMALFFAFIAALVAVLAGFMSDARMGTVAIRAMVVIVAGWLLSYIVLLILENRVGFSFEKVNGPIAGISDSSQDSEPMAQMEAEDGSLAESEADDKGSQEEVSQGFVPLAEQDLRHVNNTPQE